jgi:hypothetical protein
MVLTLLPTVALAEDLTVLFLVTQKLKAAISSSGLTAGVLVLL